MNDRQRDDHEAACRAERAPTAAPTLTSDDVRDAFDAWWRERGYPEPIATTPHAAAVEWDAYHARMGIAWSAFQAGVRAALGERKS
jgi:hypothetical protein